MHVFKPNTTLFRMKPLPKINYSNILMCDVSQVFLAWVGIQGLALVIVLMGLFVSARYRISNDAIG